MNYNRASRTYETRQNEIKEVRKKRHKLKLFKVNWIQVQTSQEVDITQTVTRIVSVRSRA